MLKVTTQNKIKFTLIVIFIIIIFGIIAWPLSTSIRPNSTQSFSLNDTAMVSQITLKSTLGSINLIKKDKIWYINNQYEADPNLMKLLLSTFIQVQTKRSLSSTQANQLKLENMDPIHIHLMANGDTIHQFISIGDPASKKTYFQHKNTPPALVHIPGYQTYIHGLLSMPTSKWRIKTIFASSPQSFINLMVEFPDSTQNFEILSTEQFVRVEGLTKLDTNRMINYLSGFDNFNVIHYVDTVGQNSDDDKPIMHLSLKDAQKRFSHELDIYQSDEFKPNYLIQIDQKQWATIHPKLFEFIHKPKKYFRYNR